MKKCFLAICVLGSLLTNAQEIQKDAITKAVVHVLDSINAVKIAQEKSAPKKEHWYESISLRGYAQIRTLIHKRQSCLRPM
jgi:hypothetical protein